MTANFDKGCNFRMKTANFNAKSSLQRDHLPDCYDGRSVQCQIGKLTLLKMNLMIDLIKSIEKDKKGSS